MKYPGTGCYIVINPDNDEESINVYFDLSDVNLTKPLTLNVFNKMNNIIEQLGIKFISIVDVDNTIVKYTDGERRITSLLNELPVIGDVDELIITIDECINGIPPENPGFSVPFVSCDINLTEVKIWDDKDYRSGPHESYTLQEFKSVLLLWKEFLQKPPLYGSKVK